MPLTGSGLTSLTFRPVDPLPELTCTRTNPIVSPMRTLFLADAHLRRPDDANYRRMLAHLDAQCGHVDCLVLLGDIFDFWIGNGRVIEDHAPMIDALERLRQHGAQLVYVEGNHDFHLGPVFTERLNCRVLPDGGTLEIDGRKVYLAHGDLANPRDTGYLWLRRFLRSALIAFLIRNLPTTLLESIAKLASRESRKTSGEKRHRWPARDLLVAFARKHLAAGHQAVVTGHFHQPFHEKLGEGELVALGDWIEQYSYAVCENGVFHLATYAPADDTADSPA